MDKINTFQFHHFVEKDGQTFAVFIDNNHQERTLKVTDYDDEGERHLIFQPENK